MDPQPYVSLILDDEGLAGDLESDESERFLGWMIIRARQLAADAKSDAEAKSTIELLCKRGREISAEAARQPDPKAALEALLAKEV